MTARADGRFTLLGDEPHVGKADPLGYDALAAELTDLILRSRDSTPLALGLRGAWGAGKSSLMRRVQAQLQERDKGVETVWFSAWTAERGNTLEALIKSVLEKIDPNALRRALRDEHIMTAVRTGVLMLAGWFQVGALVDGVWKRLELDPRARNQVQALLQKTMDGWLAQTPPPGSSGHLIVVFIDDLDRCSPMSVFRIFEAVKLYLNARGFVFVLGYDETAISDAVLAEKHYSKSTTSKQYLEKIIQIDFRLPRPDDTQIEGLIDSYLKASGTASLLGESERKLIVEQHRRNPRRIKRFINNFVMDYRLGDDSAEFSPELLIKALIVQDFKDFTDLFSGTARKNLLTEFVDYERVRSAIRQGDPLTDADRAVFPFYGIAPPTLTAEGRLTGADPDAVVRTLDARAPKDFAPFVERPEFVALLRGISDEDRERLVGRVLNTKLRIEAEREAERAEQKTAAAAPREEVPRSLDRLRILWVDPNPKNNAREVDAIKQLGGVVEQVLDARTAIQFLRPSEGEAMVIEAEPRYHALISSIARPDGPDGGLGEAALYRRLYKGPIVFYTQRITEDREKGAANLGARLTNRFDELLGWLQGIASARTPERRAPA